MYYKLNNKIYGVSAMANSKNNDEHFYFAPFGGMPDGDGDGIGANSSIITYQKGDKTLSIMMDFGVKLPTDEMKAKYPGISGVMPEIGRAHV